MGATDIWMTVDGSKTRDEVKKIVSARSEQDGHEHGHSYSGSWSEIRGGVVFYSTVVEGEQAAYDFIEGKFEKWGPAVAVQAKLADMDKLEKSIRYQNLKKQVNEAQRELNINYRNLSEAKRRSAQKKIDALWTRIRAKEDEAAKKGRLVWVIGALVSE